jgi:hypothetical protein
VTADRCACAMVKNLLFCFALPDHDMALGAAMEPSARCFAETS